MSQKLKELKKDQINNDNVLAYRKDIPWFIKGQRVSVSYDEDLSPEENEENCKQYARKLGYIGNFEDITFRVKTLEKGYIK